MIHFTKKIIFLFILFGSFNSHAQWTIYNSSSGVPIDYPSSIKITTSGEIWVGTNNTTGSGDGISNYDGTSWTSYDHNTSGFPNDFINTISINGNQVVIGTAFGGAGQYNSGVWTTTNKTNTSNKLADNDVTGLSYDNNGYLWYATDGGLYVDSNSGIWRSFTTSNSAGMPTNHLTSLYIDNQNTKWIGSGANGLLKLTTINNVYTWTVYNTSNSSIPSNKINKIIAASNGNLWLCTDAGLAVFDKSSSWTTYNTTNSEGAITNNTINDVAIDNLGNTYIATQDGLVLKAANNVWVRYAHTSSATSLPENIITSVAVKSNGDLWVGTSASGVATLNRSAILATKDAVINTENIGIYPNPTEGEIHIALEVLRSSEEMQLVLVDLAGKEIFNTNVKDIAPGIYSNTINLSGIPTGVYLLKINTTGQVLTKKIIKY